MRLIEHWMLEREQGVDDLVCGGKIWGDGNYRSCMRQQTFDPNSEWGDLCCYPELAFLQMHHGSDGQQTATSSAEP